MSDVIHPDWAEALPPNVEAHVADLEARLDEALRRLERARQRCRRLREFKRKVKELCLSNARLRDELKAKESSFREWKVAAESHRARDTKATPIRHGE